jgi:hypothetical protein
LQGGKTSEISMALVGATRREVGAFMREADLLGRLVLALAIAVLPPLTGRSPSAPRLIPVSSGSCITMTPADPEGYTLTNACAACRTALVSWCDGNNYPFSVPAHRTLHIDQCRGFQSLVSEVPCEHNQ